MTSLVRICSILGDEDSYLGPRLDSHLMVSYDRYDRCGRGEESPAGALPCLPTYEQVSRVRWEGGWWDGAAGRRGGEEESTSCGC